MEVGREKSEAQSMNVTSPSSAAIAAEIAVAIAAVPKSTDLAALETERAEIVERERVLNVELGAVVELLGCPAVDSVRAEQRDRRAAIDTELAELRARRHGLRDPLAPLQAEYDRAVAAALRPRAKAAVARIRRSVAEISAAIAELEAVRSAQPRRKLVTLTWPVQIFDAALAIAQRAEADEELS